MAISDLGTLLRSMSPALSETKYYFASVEEGQLMVLANHLDSILAIFREEEGLTVVFSEDALEDISPLSGESVQGPFALITLSVQSDLMAVGFLARITAALAGEKISVNAFSAYHHDHLLVPSGRGKDAMACLARLSAGAR
ncbi:MAG: ACT domain-containing protein [Candidatus Micrarchaeota archaeon]